MSLQPRLTGRLKCYSCGAMFNDPDEEADPYRDDLDNPLCYDCFCDEYQFRCCSCGEWGYNEDQHKMLVVTKKTQGIKRGVYRVVRLPYYADGMIEGIIFEDCLEWIADLPEKLHMNDCPCGHLCVECQAKVLEATL